MWMVRLDELQACHYAILGAQNFMHLWASASEVARSAAERAL